MNAPREGSERSLALSALGQGSYSCVCNARQLAKWENALLPFADPGRTDDGFLSKAVRCLALMQRSRNDCLGGLCVDATEVSSGSCFNTRMLFQVGGRIISFYQSRALLFPCRHVLLCKRIQGRHMPTNNTKYLS